MRDCDMKNCPVCKKEFEDDARFCAEDGAPLDAGIEDYVNPPDPYLNTIIDNQFKITDIIGKGSMGTVYKANQYALDRDVAIKILHKELTGDDLSVKRFSREARIISQLEHPNIVHVYMFGYLKDNLYIAMEYVKGTQLSQLLKEIPLPINKAIHIIKQILSALAEAHTKNVVHRDIKPENIMLTSISNNANFVKILDFGIAKFIDAKTLVTQQQGLIFGTAKYISPEAACGEEVEPRSDLYSLGVLFYQLVAGRLPFDAKTAVDFLLKHLNEAPIPIKSVNPQIPDDLANLIMSLLEKDKSKRPKNAIMVISQLEKIKVLDDESTTERGRVTYDNIKSQYPTVKEKWWDTKSNVSISDIPEVQKNVNDKKKIQNIPKTQLHLEDKKVTQVESKFTQEYTADSSISSSINGESFDNFSPVKRYLVFIIIFIVIAIIGSTVYYFGFYSPKKYVLNINNNKSGNNIKLEIDKVMPAEIIPNKTDNSIEKQMPVFKEIKTVEPQKNITQPHNKIDSNQITKQNQRHVNKGKAKNISTIPLNIPPITKDDVLTPPDPFQNQQQNQNKQIESPFNQPIKQEEDSGGEWL